LDSASPKLRNIVGTLLISEITRNRNFSQVKKGASIFV
jgi:hypothetical protein